MPKYVVQYHHIREVNIEADSPQRAFELAPELPGDTILGFQGMEIIEVDGQRVHIPESNPTRDPFKRVDICDVCGTELEDLDDDEEENED